MIEVLKKRRTQYSLGPNLKISTDTIDALVRESIRLAPSPFHSQSSRAVIWTCNGFVPVTYLTMPPWLRTRAG